MSVRKNERGESRLAVHEKTNRLIKHTVEIMGNPKVFDPAHAKLHERVLDALLRAGECMWEANGIFVGKGEGAEERYRRRRALQDEAIGKLNLLLYLITTERTVDKLRWRKYAHWSKLATECRDMARAWRDSDAQRYGRLSPGNRL